MLFVSTSGALGKYLSISPPLAIWYRSIIGFVFLFFISKSLKKSFRINYPQHRIPIFIASFLMAFHWIFYFFALQFSNVAIGMISLFTYPVFTTFLEPFILKKPFDYVQIIFGLFLILGIYFLIPEYNLDNNITLGVVFGLISAVSYSLRNILLKKPSQEIDGIVLMSFQTLFITIILLPVVFIYDHSPLAYNWLQLLVLGILTTAIGHTLFIMSFRHFSISKVSILSSIQPLFGIIIAFIFLNEIPNMNTFIGGTIIVSLVILESLRKEIN